MREIPPVASCYTNRVKVVQNNFGEGDTSLFKLLSCLVVVGSTYNLPQIHFELKLLFGSINITMNNQGLVKTDNLFGKFIVQGNNMTADFFYSLHRFRSRFQYNLITAKNPISRLLSCCAH